MAKIAVLLAALFVSSCVQPPPGVQRISDAPPYFGIPDTVATPFNVYLFNPQRYYIVHVAAASDSFMFTECWLHPKGSDLMVLRSSQFRPMTGAVYPPAGSVLRVIMRRHHAETTNH